MKTISISLTEKEAESLTQVLRFEMESLEDFLSKEVDATFQDQLATVEKIYQQLVDFSQGAS